MTDDHLTTLYIMKKNHTVLTKTASLLINSIVYSTIIN